MVGHVKAIENPKLNECILWFFSMNTTRSLQFWNHIQKIFAGLVSQLEAFFSSVSISCPKLGLNSAAFTNQNGEIGIGSLERNIMFLDKFSGTSRRWTFLAQVKPQFFQGWWQSDSFGGHLEEVLIWVFVPNQNGFLFTATESDRSNLLVANQIK